MLIKRIEMQNFRQFIGKNLIEFACDKTKNITMIMGENGAGKTTLAQAFLWVLYGETDFKDKKVISKKAIENDDEAWVRVDLTVEEDNKDYIISRIQKVTKKTNKINEEQARLQISYKNGGQTLFLAENECQHFIENILPNELSKFFFFDGERIKNMSDEIQKGKSKEFVNAVRNLVGLNAIMNSIEHIKDTRNSSTVIGRYNKKIDESGGEKIVGINKQIDQIISELDELQGRHTVCKKNIDYYQRESFILEQEIMSFAPAEKLKKQYDNLTIKLKVLELEKINATKNYFLIFNNQSLGFFLNPVIEASFKELKSTDKLDKGIPHVHADTVKYLMKKERCMCGNKIIQGSDESIELTKLLEYLPPKSIGTLINLNMKKSEMNLRQSKSFHSSMESSFTAIRKIQNEIDSTTKMHTDLYHKIVDLSTLQEKKVKKSEFDRKFKNSSEALDIINQSIGSYKSKLEKLNNAKDEYVNINKANKKFQIYREYARELYNLLSEDYLKAEEDTKDELESKINNIFGQIYNGGFSLSLDKNYNIKITVDELDESSEDIERSTAQNYSVIFAFISGIIEMAKERSEDDNSGIFDKAVGYPLVMDAPLSAFDKKRINNICDTLPGIAQQVIFFIKDTDGSIAEEKLGKSVGMKYIIEKESELISAIKGR